MIKDLIITCRTTCGCGAELVPYTSQTETTHYLLTCKPHRSYDHPLLIAIDKGSPVFEKSEKWDKHSKTIETILQLKKDIDTLHDYEIANLLPKYLFTIQKDRADIQRLNQNRELEQEIKQLKEEYEELRKTFNNTTHLLVKESDNLKQKLETSYEALQRVRDERNTAWTKLEKIKELSSYEFLELPFQFDKELGEILENRGKYDGT